MSSQFLEILEAQDEPEEARTIGPYEITCLLGRGGMGMVYAARDPRLAREVAVKVLRGFGAGEHVERFRREEVVLARLRHPGIVEIFDVGVQDDVHYFVMELVAGSSLADALERGMPRRDAVEVIRQAAEAVHFAHGRGVLHRDLKPGNILVSANGRAKALDFGLAKLKEGQELALSTSGMFFGTPAYMSPEQASGRVRDVDERSDVYGLGATLYHALTGSAPFRGGSIQEVIERARAQEPKGPRSIDPTIAPELELVVLRALEKDPQRRYRSAGVFAADLGRYLSGEPVSAKPPSLSHRLKRWASRRRRMLAGAATLLLLAGSAAWAISSARSGARFRRERAAAERAYAAGDWVAAGAACERALALRPDPAVARMAEVCRTREREERERRERSLARAEKFRSAQERVLQPLWTELQKLRLLGYAPRVRYGGRVRECLDEAEKLLDDPDLASYPEPWSFLGIGRYLTGEPDRAERYLLRAEELAPEDGWTAFYLGRIYLERSVAARLTYTFDDAADGWEGEAKGWTDQALLRLNREGKFGEGAEPIDRKIARAYALLALRDREGLLRLCEEALREFGSAPGTEHFHYVLGWSGNSLEDYEKAIARRPHFPWAHFRKGLIFQERRRLPEAIREFTQEIEQNPCFAEAWLSRGVARSELGGFADAWRTSRKARASCPARDAARITAASFIRSAATCRWRSSPTRRRSSSIPRSCFPRSTGAGWASSSRRAIRGSAETSPSRS